MGGILLIVLWAPGRRRSTVEEASTSRRWRRLGATAGAAMVAVSLLFLHACGDGGTKPLSGGTVPGSYDLTVTAAWESVQASATVALVVQEP